MARPKSRLPWKWLPEVICLPHDYLVALPGFFGDETGRFTGLGVGVWVPLPFAMIETPEVQWKKEGNETPE